MVDRHLRRVDPAGMGDGEPRGADRVAHRPRVPAGVPRRRAAGRRCCSSTASATARRPGARSSRPWPATTSSSRRTCSGTATRPSRGPTTPSPPTPTACATCSACWASTASPSSATRSGGGVAMQFAYQFPEKTERMVLVASGGAGRGVSPLLRAATLPGAAGGAVGAAAAGRAAGGRRRRWALLARLDPGLGVDAPDLRPGGRGAARRRPRARPSSARCARSSTGAGRS